MYMDLICIEKKIILVIFNPLKYILFEEMSKPLTVNKMLFQHIFSSLGPKLAHFMLKDIINYTIQQFLPFLIK